MKIRNPLQGLFVSTLIAISSFSGSAGAVQVADGTVYFNQVPRLLGAVADYKSTRIPNARYDFHFFLPDAAQEPLKTVTFSQKEGFDSIDFNLGKTLAYVGGNRKQTFPVTATVNPQGQMTVTFAQPISPGTEFTIRLRAKRNPDTGGTYLFGVTAFPDGEKAYGQFLGFGRLPFFEGGDSSF